VTVVTVAAGTVVIAVTTALSVFVVGISIAGIALAGGPAKADDRSVDELTA
jgi:hypothetical protein